MNSRKLLLALLLPALVLALWLAKLETRRVQGREVVLEVQAYDPRDLLSGHYLQYAVNYGTTPCQLNFDRGQAVVCVCLDPRAADQPASALWSGACSARPDDCELYLQGTCEYSRFVTGIERFYIPEAYAAKLVQFPPNATIKVRVAGDGSALVKEFLVDGAPLSDYVAKQP